MKVFKEKQEELEVFAIEYHRFYFDIAQILSVVLDCFANKTWDYAVIWDSCFSNIKKYRLL